MSLKKIIATALVAVVSITTVFAAEPYQVSAKNTKKTISVSYPDGAFNDEEMKASVVYSDTFFTKSTAKRQDSLALLSAAAADTAYNEKDIKSFMKACGFSNSRQSVSDEAYNNLSFNFGKKKIGKKTVVAVVLEGTSTSEEWRSNLNLGTGTIHDGFNTTEKAVHKKLNSYIKKNKLKKGSMVFWVTGHSRGAAVADIMAKRLSDTYGKNAVYAYTFAAPKVTKSRDKDTSGYTNIYNYINPDDLVTTLPPENSDDLAKTLGQLGLLDSDTLSSILISNLYQEFGTYRRYGTDVVMSDSDHDLMAQTFSDITGSDFDDTSVEHNHCQSCYLSWLMG